MSTITNTGKLTSAFQLVKVCTEPPQPTQPNTAKLGSATVASSLLPRISSSSAKITELRFPRSCLASASSGNPSDKKVTWGLHTLHFYEPDDEDPSTKADSPPQSHVSQTFHTQRRRDSGDSSTTIHRTIEIVEEEIATITLDSSEKITGNIEINGYVIREEITTRTRILQPPPPNPQQKAGTIEQTQISDTSQIPPPPNYPAPLPPPLSASTERESPAEPQKQEIPILDRNDAKKSSVHKKSPTGFLGRLGQFLTTSLKVRIR